MPFSQDTFDILIRHVITRVNASSFLDLGAGAGKYGSFVRELSPSTTRTAVEIEANYVARYNLAAIYNNILCMPAAQLIDKQIECNFDLVIWGDCIEHMKKSEGIDLLNFLIYRSKYIVVIFPHRYIQGPWEGFKNEAHISAWHQGDFAQFDPIFLAKANMRAVLMNGYLRSPSDPPIDSLLPSDGYDHA